MSACTFSFCIIIIFQDLIVAIIGALRLIDSEPNYQNFQLLLPMGIETDENKS